MVTRRSPMNIALRRLTPVASRRYEAQHHARAGFSRRRPMLRRLAFLECAIAASSDPSAAQPPEGAARGGK